MWILSFLENKDDDILFELYMLPKVMGKQDYFRK